MIKIFLIFSLILLSSCSQKNNEQIKSQSNIIEKNMTKYVKLKWKVDNLYIVNLPENTEEEILKACGSKKFALVTIDTSIKNVATGKFRCD